MTQYSGVYTLQQQGQALTSGQWATDPYYKNTTLLLHADGVTGGAQNNAFLDSSTNALAITRNGNTTQGSFTPYGPDWSVNFGSTSGDDGIYLSGQSAFAFGTGDFTIEMWVNLKAGSDQILIDFRPSGTQGAYPTIYLDGTTSTLRYYVNTADRITSTTVFTFSTWHHVAVCRSGTSTKLFLDGIQQGSTYTDSNNYIVGTNRPYTGYGIAGTVGMMYGGYLSNLRIMKGQALYTSTFTPSTTRLTTTSQGAIAANVSLLTAQSNRFIDNSSNGFTVTTIGTVSIKRVSPFAPQYQYTTAVIGGSGYFDGTGDYLSVDGGTQFAMGTGAFTIEGWVYPTTSSTGPLFVLADMEQAGGIGVAGGDYVAGPYLFTRTLSYDLTSTTPLQQNAWNHVAVVRDGSSNTSIFLNGTRIANGTVSVNYTSTSGNSMWIGNSAFSNATTGNMTDVRIVKGTAVYSPSSTTITVPTSPLTAVANTQLLCNMTNAGIYDNTMINNLETVGNAQVSTNVVKYGSGSLAFNGSTDWLYNNVGFPDFNNGDFTIEMWVYRNSTARGGLMRSGGSTTNGSTGQWFFYFESTDGRLYWQSRVGVTNAWGVDASSLAVNTWNHIAVVRQNTLWSVYFNGVAQVPATGSFSDSTSYSNAQSSVGGNFSGYNFNGYIDDLRVTNGVARYTSNFVPPKVAFANQ